jgi:hypothetical protein
MTSPRPAALVIGAIVLVIAVELLRRRQLREKYAAVWLVIGVGAVVIGVFPAVLTTASRLLGFAVPANLLFFVGGMVLLVMSMQLSLEIGRAEERARRLAEEIALLRLDVQRLQRQSPPPGLEQGRGPLPHGEEPGAGRPAR